MSFLPISIPGVLKDNSDGNAASSCLVFSPPRECNVVGFSPAVAIAPVGLDLVLRVSLAPPAVYGQTFTGTEYIDATIKAGEYIAAPGVGLFYVPANTTIYVWVISGPVGANAASFLAGNIEVTDGVSIGDVDSVNRSTFEGLVSSIVNRGTQFDKYIPGAIRRAIRFFESGNNFPYMRRIESFVKNPNGSATEKATVISLGQRIKRLDSVRRYDPTATSRDYTYLTGVPIDDISELAPAHNPEFYWTTYSEYDDDVWSGGTYLLNLGTLGFLSTFTLEAIIYEYTDYKTLRIIDDHWLLSAGENVVLAQTMINLAPILRQPEIMQVWAPLLTSGIKNLLLAADEMDVDQHSKQMGYGEE